MQLTSTEREYLLRTARGAIEEHLDARQAAHAGAHHKEPPSAQLLEPCGAFVTLRMPVAGELRLRGCMGVVVATRPLVESVRDSAVSAAFRDPRFPALTREELEACSIEISVLSRMMPCTPEEVEPGRDGVMLSYGPASGLLLPQVAVEQGWDRDTFLSHLCRKAGVGPECWRDPRAKLQRFTATVFTEAEA